MSGRSTVPREYFPSAHDGPDRIEDLGVEVGAPVMGHLQHFRRQRHPCGSCTAQEHLLALVVQVGAEEEALVAVREAKHDRVAIDRMAG